MGIRSGNTQKELLVRSGSSLALFYGQQNTLAWTWLASPRLPSVGEMYLLN
jgi:hypothetical protein